MRKPPLKLEQLSILKARTALCTEELNELDYLMTGFVGEVEFDRVLDEYIQGTNNIHLKDYRFKTKTDADSFRKVDTKSSEVQIDSLLISKNRIFTFEIKNYNQDLKRNSRDFCLVAVINQDLKRNSRVFYLVAVTQYVLNRNSQDLCQSNTKYSLLIYAIH